MEGSGVSDSWISGLVAGVVVFGLGVLTGEDRSKRSRAFRKHRYHSRRFRRSFRNRNPWPNRERELQAARHADIERELVAYLKEVREMMQQLNRKFEIDAEVLPKSANASDPANPGAPEAEKKQ
jgi:hypothetical protein